MSLNAEETYYTERIRDTTYEKIKIFSNFSIRSNYINCILNINTNVLCKALEQAMKYPANVLEIQTSLTHSKELETEIQNIYFWLKSYKIYILNIFHNGNFSYIVR